MWRDTRTTPLGADGSASVLRERLSGLVEGQKINFEVQRDRRTGKSAAENLSKAA